MEEKRKPRPWLKWYVTGLVAMFGFYVLSVGPALRMFNQGYFTDESLGRFYYPLLCLLCYMPMEVTHAWQWYQTLWLP